MAAVASSRMVSATVLLTLIITGWCLAMASAAPVANARRLQQQIPRNVAENLATGLQHLIVQVQGLLAEITAQAKPQILLSLEDPLNQALRQLQPLASTLRNQLQEQSSSGVTMNQQLQAAAGALKQLQAAVLGLHQNVPTAVQEQLQTFGSSVQTIQNLLNDVQGQVQRVAPGGLENLLSNRQNVFGLVPGIQGSAGAQQEP